ncbi:hypothetical protein CAEBREN_14388 [Caenorhabditis brenneri]|uniref:RING-type domain-containing protein n=1 Tax=Caenorhabditis brenneri TaxID=135651 RepID=G0MWW9_CAEBE|nr:hypothetical protein CAEBREN_14388 [Caenorhabditis brenneri]
MSNYKTSKLQYYKWADLEPCENNTGGCFHRNRKTGQMILANISGIPEEAVAELMPNYFLLSSDEAKQMTTTMFGQQFLSEEGRVMIMSLTNFMPLQMKLELYKTSLAPASTKKTNARLFPGLLAKYRERRKSPMPMNILQQVISTEEAIEIFDQFNINKSLITVVPDIPYQHSVMKRFQNGTETLATFNHNSEKSLYKEEALWMVFKECVCGFDWDESQNVDNFLRRQIIDAMYIMNAAGVTMFTLNFVRVFLSIKASPDYWTSAANKPSSELDYFFEKKLGNSSMSKAEYYQMADTFHLAKYETDPEDYIPVWKVRVYMATAWINQFFGKSDRVLREQLMYGVRHFVLEPGALIVIQKLLACFVSHDAPKAQRSVPKIRLLHVLTETSRFALKSCCCRDASFEIGKCSGTVSKSTETLGPPEKVSKSSQTVSSPPEKFPKLLKTPEPLKELMKSTEAVPKPFEVHKNPKPPNSKLSQTPKPKPNKSLQAPPSAPTDPSNESKLCDKCNRNGKALNTAKTALAEAQAKASKYETQAKQTREMEKKMKKLRKENEHQQKDIKDMKVEKEKCDERETILKNEIVKLTGKVKDLEGKLENEQQEKTNFEEESAMLRRNFEILQVHVAKRESKRPYVNRPSIFTPTGSKMSVDDWVRVKEDFENDEVWVVAKKRMIENLISKTADPEIRRYCQFELSQYVGSIQLYETIINLNIEKINFTGETSNLQPLPNYPHLSQKFIDLFNEMLKKEADEVPSDPENECYICQEAFADEEKRLFCSTCKKPVHLTCEADWEEAQKKSMIKELSCGHCRGKETFKDDLEKENRDGKQ